MPNIIRNGIQVGDARDYSGMRFIDSTRPKYFSTPGPNVYNPTVGASYKELAEVANFLAYRKSCKHWWNIVDYSNITDTFELEDLSLPSADHEVGYAPFKGLPGDAYDIDVIIPEISPNVDHLGIAFRYQATYSSGFPAIHAKAYVSLSYLDQDPELDAIDFGYNLWTPHISGGEERSGLIDTLRSGANLFSKSDMFGIAWNYGYTLNPNRGSDPSDITDSFLGLRALNAFPEAKEAGGPYKVRFSGNNYCRIIAAYVIELPWRIEDKTFLDPTTITPSEFTTGFPT